MKKIAFICYGNSCRSQMAEGLSKIYGNGLFKVYSAGISPLGEVSPHVYEVMKKRGIDISMQYSKGLNDILFDEMDFIIAMGCGTVDNVCPNNYEGCRIEWDIPDPYGGPVERFEEVCNIIEGKLKEFIETFFLHNLNWNVYGD